MIELDCLESELAKIRVIGVGGCGGNAINNMIERGLAGVKFISANTDKQVLDNNKAQVKIHMGLTTTKGLGAGGKPEVGESAARESLEELKEALKGSDMIFVTAGMGGGTGTGAAPIVAKIGKELGALVVAIVTKPFKFEGRRHKIAELGLSELRQYVDALISIPNQKLLDITDKNVPVKHAYLRADEILYNATRGISDIITHPGLVNVDFADVRAVMEGMGEALMGTGVATGSNRAQEATQNALNSPLLDGLSIKGAQGVLVNITGNEDSVTLHEISEAVTIIEEAAGNDVNLIHGVVLTKEPMDEIMVTVVATGFSTNKSSMSVPGVSYNKSSVVELPFTNATKRNSQLVAETASSEPRMFTPYPTITKAPRGNAEQKTFDTPAYLRRPGNDNDSFDKSLTAIEQMHESDTIVPFSEDNRIMPSSEQPSFIRRMMD